MKNFLLVACFAVLCAACVPNDSPIRILGAHPLSSGEGECSSSEIQQYSGNLDISASENYLIEFGLASDLQQISTSVGGEVLAGPDRNDFYAKELVLSYTSVPALAFGAAERVPVHMVLPAGAEAGKSFIRAYLLTEKAAQTLATGVVAGSAPVELAATFEIRGELASGGALRSNTVTFPITVFNSSFPGCAPITTAAGTILNPRAPNGPCGLPGGQDGTLPGCCLISDADAGFIVNPAFADFCGSGT